MKKLPHSKAHSAASVLAAVCAVLGLVYVTAKPPPVAQTEARASLRPATGELPKQWQANENAAIPESEKQLAARTGSASETPHEEPPLGGAESAPSILNPYSDAAISDQLALAIGAGELTTEVVARHREEKFNSYLANVAAQPGAPAPLPAQLNSKDEGRSASDDRKNPYRLLKQQGESEATSDGPAERRATPSTYLQTVHQLPQ
ncbi:MAG: hypothetical protein U0136_04615 [Bdellovibrionota bacterium]